MSLRSVCRWLNASAPLADCCSSAPKCCEPLVCTPRCEVAVLELRYDLGLRERQQRLDDWDTNDSKASRTQTIALSLIAATLTAQRLEKLPVGLLLPGLICFALALFASTAAQWPQSVPIFSHDELALVTKDMNRDSALQYVLSRIAQQHAALDSINTFKTRLHKLTLVALLAGVIATVACTSSQILSDGTPKFF